MVSFTMVIVIPRVIIPTRYRSRNRDITLAAPRICRYRFLHGTGAPNGGRTNHGISRIGGLR